MLFRLKFQCRKFEQIVMKIKTDKVTRTCKHTNIYEENHTILGFCSLFWQSSKYNKLQYCIV